MKKQLIDEIYIELGYKDSVEYIHDHLKTDNELDAEQVIQWICTLAERRWLSRLPKIYFKGGDPLLYIKQIKTIVNALRDKQILCKFYVITTPNLLNLYNKTLEEYHIKPIILFDGTLDAVQGRINIPTVEYYRWLDNISNLNVKPKCISLFTRETYDCLFESYCIIHGLCFESWKIEVDNITPYTALQWRYMFPMIEEVSIDEFEKIFRHNYYFTRSMQIDNYNLLDEELPTTIKILLNPNGVVHRQRFSLYTHDAYTNNSQYRDTPLIYNEYPEVTDNFLARLQYNPKLYTHLICRDTINRNCLDCYLSKSCITDNIPATKPDMNCFLYYTISKGLTRAIQKKNGIYHGE